MKINIALEGGGAKGYALPFALKALQERGLEVGRWAGTSAGAITAALGSVGCSPDEMIELSSERPRGRSLLMSFLDISHPWILSGWWGLHRHGGIFRGEAFRRWVTRIINRKTEVRNPEHPSLGLGELHSIAGVDATLVAFDLTAGRRLDLNWRTAPGIPIAWAVRASMSIPNVWRPVIWDPAWGRYKGRDLSGHLLVDGGVVANYPIDVFLGASRFDGWSDRSDDPVVGLLLDESLPANAEASGGLPLGRLLSWAVGPVIRRNIRLFEGIINARNRELAERHGQTTCRIPVRGFGTLQDYSEDRQAELGRAGWVAATGHAEGREDLSND